MALRTINIIADCSKLHTTFNILHRRQCVKRYSISRSAQTLCNDLKEKISSKTWELLEKNKEKIAYNSILYFGRHNLVRIDNSLKDYREKKMKRVPYEAPLPLSLKFVNNASYLCGTEEKNIVHSEQAHVHFPFKNVTQVADNCSNTDGTNNYDISVHDSPASTSYNEVQQRKALYTNGDVRNWMTDYENYDDEVSDDQIDWKVNYGTPDKASNISEVPCSGCGAFLHCKDISIPGYLPSEIYKHGNRRGVQLKEMICQRCHFLKHYNMALKVQVTSEDYLKVLYNIRGRNAIVILMVDLLDFPCSIWPGIADILGRKPIVVVANKIDLLPQDSEKFLQRVKTVLTDNLKLNGFASSQIKDIHLISAKTGFGIEDLISSLHSLWQLKGDYYIVGSTNVGKSSLFNILLQSDFCKVQDSDLLQRATTSPWPGTTLNLLKFPILRPSGLRSYLRAQRLRSANKLYQEQNKLRQQQLKSTGDSKYASLIGHMGRTFDEKIPEEVADMFNTTNDFENRPKVGINEKDKDYRLSRWCYDTPGVVHDDQIIHLLTTEELLLTLPKEIISPKTFCLRPKSTIFIAGLARLDYVEGNFSVRFTVFCSEALPITVCKLEDAEDVYKTFLGTEVFQVPVNNPERLREWPNLATAQDIKVVGDDLQYSCADVVLSNAGWVSVTGKYREEMCLKAWTPDARGIHVRSALLPRAVALRGMRVRGTPAYAKSKFFVG